MKPIIFIFISIFFMNCSNKQKEQVLLDERDMVIQMKKDTISDTVVFQKQDIFTVSEDSLFYELAEQMFIKNPRTLQILTDGNLTYYPFGVFKSIKDFQNKYSHFKEEKEFIKADTVYKFLYKESFIKVHYNGNVEVITDRLYGDELNIVSGRIVNKEIQLIEEVRVGISKNNLLQKFFSNEIMSMYDFSNVDTLINSSSADGIEQHYIFINDILKEIIMKSDYEGSANNAIKTK